MNNDNCNKYVKDFFNPTLLKLKQTDIYQEVTEGAISSL
jgi:hypothetical protein